MRLFLLALQLDQAARATVPTVTVGLLILPGLLPLGAPWLSETMPHFAMIAVFYWTLYRPDLLPPAAVFLIGLLSDILAGHPTGLAALTLLAVHVVVQNQRQAFVLRSFPIVWGGFALIAAAAFLGMWLITCLLALRLVMAPAAVAQFGATVLCFPVLAWGLVRVHRQVIR